MYDYVKPKVYNAKKKDLKGKYYRADPDLDGVTLRPILNYTMNSKAAKKVANKRIRNY